MKTIKVFALICIFVTSFLSCNNDDEAVGVIPNRFETRQDVLESQLEKYALDIEKRSLLDRREEVVGELEQNPNDQFLLAELESIDERVVSIAILNESIDISLVGFGIGPVPPPPPCPPITPDPTANCIFDFSGLERIFVDNNLGDFQIIFIDSQTEQNLYESGEFSTSEISQVLDVTNVPLQDLNLPEEFVVLVNKVQNGVNRSYSFKATANN